MRRPVCIFVSLAALVALMVGCGGGDDDSGPEPLVDLIPAALACGADPFKIVQLQWHASPCEEVGEKIGVSWDQSKKNFEAYLKEVEAGNIEYLYDPELAISR